MRIIDITGDMLYLRHNSMDFQCSMKAVLGEKQHIGNFCDLEGKHQQILYDSQYGEMIRDIIRKSNKPSPAR